MIIFDEKDYAEHIITNGYRNKKYISRDSIILVKYWKYKGLSEKEIDSNLRKILREDKKIRNSSILDSKIEMAMYVGMRYDLVTGVAVEILDNEIELINQIETDQQRRLMFVMLVIWKFWGMKNFRASNKDLIGLTKIKMDNNVFWDNIFQLTKSGILSMRQYKRKDYYVIDIEQTGKPVIKINNYKNLVYHYLAFYEPEKYDHCKECGAIIKATSNRKIYCRWCWREKQLKWQRESMKKARK